MESNVSKFKSWPFELWKIQKRDFVSTKHLIFFFLPHRITFLGIHVNIIAQEGGRENATSGRQKR